MTRVQKTDSKDAKRVLRKAYGQQADPPKTWIDLWGAILRTASGESSLEELSRDAGLNPADVVAWFSDPDFTGWLAGEATNYVKTALRMYEIKMAARVLEGEFPPLKIMEFLAKRHDPEFINRSKVSHEISMPDFAKMGKLEMATYAISVMPAWLSAIAPMAAQDPSRVEDTQTHPTLEAPDEKRDDR